MASLSSVPTRLLLACFLIGLTQLAVPSLHAMPAHVPDITSASALSLPIDPDLALAPEALRARAELPGSEAWPLRQLSMHTVVDEAWTRLLLATDGSETLVEGITDGEVPSRYLLGSLRAASMDIQLEGGRGQVALSLIDPLSGQIAQPLLDGRVAWSGEIGPGRPWLLQVVALGEAGGTFDLRIRARQMADDGRIGPAAHAAPMRAAAGGRVAKPAVEGRTLYLTFDDGPSPEWTPQVMRLLERYRARATFFVIGDQVDRHPGLVEDLQAAGHVVAAHGQSHAGLTGLRGAQLRAEIEPLRAKLGPSAGTCLRAPFGEADAYLRAYASELGLTLLKWDVDPRDWARPGVVQIASSILEEVRPGSVVLLHDGGGDRRQSLEALEFVLRSLTAEGYRFEAICAPEARPDSSLVLR